MITLSKKRNEFIQDMRAKMNSTAVQENANANLVVGDDINADLMTLLEKRFDELFGPIDDND